MFCQKCGAQNDDQAAFCSKCGTTLEKPQTPMATPETGYAGGTEYAGFWKRFGAAIIDWLIMIPVSLLMQLPFGISPFSGGLDPDATTGELTSYFLRSGITSVLSIVVTWLYSALMESSKFQATLGKMVLGIVVTDMNGQRISFGRATGRYFAEIISQIILFLYLIIAFTEKKQGLHDIIASTLVVVKKK